MGSPQRNLFTARDGVLAALISLAGVIAVMTGFAGSTDSHVKTNASLIGGFGNSAKLMSAETVTVTLSPIRSYPSSNPFLLHSLMLNVNGILPEFWGLFFFLVLMGLLPAHIYFQVRVQSSGT